VKRVYRLYAQEGLAVRRRKRKQLVRDRVLQPRLIRPNQEWAMDFIIDGLATGRMVRILSGRVLKEAALWTRVVALDYDERKLVLKRVAGLFEDVGSYD
jgi:hypothetical protein